MPANMSPLALLEFEDSTPRGKSNAEEDVCAGATAAGELDETPAENTKQAAKSKSTQSSGA
jgi:hypothetical protein